MLRWPTSELPIWPSGRPTSRPEEARVVKGRSAIKASTLGVRARSVALPGPGCARPNPSRIARTTGRIASAIGRLLLAQAQSNLEDTPGGEQAEQAGGHDRQADQGHGEHPLAG